MYRYTDNARHGHVTLSKFVNRTIFAIPAKAAFVAGLGEPQAESPEVLKPKERQIRQLCRCIMDWPCVIFLGPVHSVALC